MERRKIIYNRVYFCSMQTFRLVNAKHTKLYAGLNVRNILDILRKIKNMTLFGLYVFNFEFIISKCGKSWSHVNLYLLDSWPLRPGEVWERELSSFVTRWSGGLATVTTQKKAWVSGSDQNVGFFGSKCFTEFVENTQILKSTWDLTFTERCPS